MAYSQSLTADFGLAYAGLTTVGYQIFYSDGTPVAARTHSGVREEPTLSGIYRVDASLPGFPFIGYVTWDTGGGSPVYATEDINIEQGLSLSQPASAEPVQDDWFYGWYMDDQPSDLANLADVQYRIASFEPRVFRFGSTVRFQMEVQAFDGDGRIVSMSGATVQVAVVKGALQVDPEEDDWLNMQGKAINPIEGIHPRYFYSIDMGAGTSVTFQRGRQYTFVARIIEGGRIEQIPIGIFCPR